MTIRHPSDFSGQYSTKMPKPEIPVRRTPAFMKALWGLALLVLIGTIYSFWRISTVATPKLDVPANDVRANDAPANAQPVNSAH